MKVGYTDLNYLDKQSWSTIFDLIDESLDLSAKSNATEKKRTKASASQVGTFIQ